MVRQGRAKDRYVNGKLVKSAFDRMPSPSTFGGGIKLGQMVDDSDSAKPLIDTIEREKYENVEREKKPFADFMFPELQYMNEPEVRDYLKQPRKVK